VLGGGCCQILVIHGNGDVSDGLGEASEGLDLFASVRAPHLHEGIGATSHHRISNGIKAKTGRLLLVRWDLDLYLGWYLDVLEGAG